MICHQFTTLLGFECSPVSEGGEISLVSTPFRFDDGDVIPVYVEGTNGQVRFFDDGQALMHFIGRGMRIENKKNAKFLSTIASANGATFNEAGEIETWASLERASDAFARFMSTMLALQSWEKDQQGTSTDLSVLVDEVAIALKAWKPEAEFKEDPPFTGISGKAYKLDFFFDGKAVAVSNPTPRSGGAVLHRLVDIKGSANNMDVDLLVVIDDRSDPEAAKRESLILQSVATVLPLSVVEAKGQGGTRFNTAAH